MLANDTRKGGLYLLWFSDIHYYGGRTSNYEHRWYRHLYDLRRGKHKNQYMQAVYTKYGCRFEPEIVDGGGESELEQIAAEQRWLDTHHGLPGCVNLSKSADSGMMRGRKHTEVAKQKMRDAVTAKVLTSLIERNKNRVWTDEQRKRHSEIHMGFKHTPETRAKMSVAQSTPQQVAKARETLERNRLKKGDKKSEAALMKIRTVAALRIGVPQSPESIAKRALKLRGRKHTDETKARMSEAGKIRAQEHPTTHGEATRALISEQQTGRVWVNDGATNRRVRPAEAEPLLAAGWLPGRKPRPEGASHGNTGRKHTPEARANMSTSKQGLVRTSEAVAKTAAANTGRKNGPEALANMRAAGALRRGRKRDPEVVARIAAARTGTKLTEETKARMSRAKVRPVDGEMPPEGVTSSEFELIRRFPAGAVLSVADVAATLPDLKINTVRMRLFRCKAAGLIEQVGPGRYRLVSRA